MPHLGFGSYGGEIGDGPLKHCRAGLDARHRLRPERPPPRATAGFPDPANRSTTAPAEPTISRTDAPIAEAVTSGVASAQVRPRMRMPIAYQRSGGRCAIHINHC